MARKDAISRREAMRAVLTLLPVAAVPASLAGQALSRGITAAGSTGMPRKGRPEAAGLADPVRPSSQWALTDLAVGTALGRCSVVRVAPILAGGVPVTLRSPDGVEFEVDVLRHDPATPGVARAGALGVYMNNNGSGSTATIEEHGLAAMALAGWLERREARGLPAPALLTLGQRAPRLASLLG